MSQVQRTKCDGCGKEHEGDAQYTVSILSSLGGSGGFLHVTHDGRPISSGQARLDFCEVACVTAFLERGPAK